MIKLEDCFYLGYVKKIHGTAGDIEVVLDVDDTSKYKKKESILLLLKNNLIPFFIEKITVKKGGAVIQLQGIKSHYEAEHLIGSQLYLPIEQLPPLKGKNKFYYHEVIGYTVLDTKLGKLGTIKDIVDESVQPVLVITHPTEKEILIPLIDEFLVEVNKSAKEFFIKTPEGLVQMYLEL